MDAGTPEQYLQLHRDLLSGKSRQYTPSEEPVIGENTVIHPTAEITGGVIIGADCSIGQDVKMTGPAAIGDGCIVLKDSIVEDSVIWCNVRLGPGARILHSIVADECCLNPDCSIENSVLADKVILSNNTRLEPGSRILPGTVVE
jgi:NDP-sugar pyrophosphorylase family protein